MNEKRAYLRRACHDKAFRVVFYETVCKVRGAVETTGWNQDAQGLIAVSQGTAMYRHAWTASMSIWQLWDRSTTLERTYQNCVGAAIDFTIDIGSGERAARERSLCIAVHF